MSKYRSQSYSGSTPEKKRGKRYDEKIGNKSDEFIEIKLDRIICLGF